MIMEQLLDSKVNSVRYTMLAMVDIILFRYFFLLLMKLVVDFFSQNFLFCSISFSRDKSREV